MAACGERFHATHPRIHLSPLTSPGVRPWRPMIMRPRVRESRLARRRPRRLSRMNAQTRPTKTLRRALRYLKRRRNGRPAVIICISFLALPILPFFLCTSQMGPPSGAASSPPLCSSARPCAALALGLISVLSWGVAEVPQIITNYKKKSTEGLSIAFLLTWIIGDLFNLLGCWLEPATLPTQFYMALLYTATTLLLTGQTVYYGHIYELLKSCKGSAGSEERETATKKGEEEREEVTLLIPSSPISVAAPLPTARTYSGNLYLMSARSLSSSPNLTSRSLAYLHEPGLTAPRSREEGTVREPLLVDPALSHTAPPMKTKRTLPAVMSTVLFLGGIGLRHSQVSRLEKSTTANKVVLVGRKILQENRRATPRAGEGGSSGVGTFLGWAMAMIYMGGRLPQICLNIRRGTVEGLSPLMFAFAIVGNATYVASILVSSLDWSKIRPNLPWLVDAGGCVVLDSFILIQFLYFQWRSGKSAGAMHEDD